MRILQIIDSLEAGGAERVAVNYANGLLGLVTESHLCATRKEGSLKQALNDDVGYVYLKKTSSIDIKAFLRLRKYLKSHKIDILHAHSTSFFLAVAMKFLIPRLRIVWHDHYGNSEFLEHRSYKMLKFCSRFFFHIISVNPRLAQWAKLKLQCKNVSYVKNYPVLSQNVLSITMLGGQESHRVICMANLREQKNHVMLLEAFKVVVQKYPKWTLHCVGKNFKDNYAKTIFDKVKALNLDDHVYFYDSKSDILNILKQGEIGVLVSKSEGLPLTLLEYGLACLPVITSDVGDCGSLVNDESLGVLIKNLTTENIAKGIIKFIEDKPYRLSSAKKYNQKIKEAYSEQAVLKTIMDIYSESKS